MANNLFIVSNALSMFNSSWIIEKEHRFDNNILVVVTHYFDIGFWNSMSDIASKLKCFSKVFLYNSYCKQMPPMAPGYPGNIVFDINKFEFDAGISNFDNVYATYFYGESLSFISKYINANLSFIENGTASYLPQCLNPQLMKRINKLYTFNYFDKIFPDDIYFFPNIKNVVIDKDEIRNKFEDFSKMIDIKEDKNSVVLCCQNVSLNKKAMSSIEEFNIYKDIANFYIERGFNVYLKNHPRTPRYFMDMFKSINSDKVRIIENPAPIEVMLPKLNPKAVVGMFSTSLLLVPHLFEIDAYTTKIKYNFYSNLSWKDAYAMVLSYIPDYKDFDKSSRIPVSNFDSNVNPLLMLLRIDILKRRIDRDTFLSVKQNIQNESEDLYEFFGISKKLIKIFKRGTYNEFLSYAR